MITSTRPRFVLRGCRHCGGDLLREAGDWACLQCARPGRPILASASLPLSRRCKVPDCLGIARNRGFCERHWTRVKRHGDPNYEPPPRKQTGGRLAHPEYAAAAALFYVKDMVPGIKKGGRCLAEQTSGNSRSPA